MYDHLFIIGLFRNLALIDSEVNCYQGFANFLVDLILTEMA
jgi:hypothetical protein